MGPGPTPVYVMFAARSVGLGQRSLHETTSLRAITNYKNSELARCEIDELKAWPREQQKRPQ